MSKSTATQRPLDSCGALLFFYTETPLHVGCGEGLGAIDLPIQRERISELPIVPGSAVKGALREVFRGQQHSDEQDLFGPRPAKPGAAEEPKFAGALNLTDARLLLLPIRTVYGGWAWATSPMILERLARDLEIVGHKRPQWANLKPPAPQKNQDPDSLALRFADQPAIAPDGNLILEDTLYTTVAATQEDGAAALLDDLKSAFPTEKSYDSIRDRLAEQLVLLTDTELKHWAKHGTEVMTRVRISEKTGTVEKGALWTEESLPSESLLWSLALMGNSRRREELHGAKLLKTFDTGLNQRVFLGGDRTIGRGLCGINLRTTGEA